MSLSVLEIRLTSIASKSLDSAKLLNVSLLVYLYINARSDTFISSCSFVLFLINLFLIFSLESSKDIKDGLLIDAISKIYVLSFSSIIKSD